MIAFLNRIRAYTLLRLSTITIKQANIFTTFFIFLFTIIFAYLLIIENYHDYERTLYEQQQNDAIAWNVNESYEVHQKKLKALLVKNTLAIATLAFILFAIMLGFYKIFNTLLQRDIQAFLDFFQASAHHEQVLNPNAIFFKEFKTMVGYANTMVDTISEQKRDLKELNMGLEERIKKKTQALVLINENLQKEKHFSEEILSAQKEFLRYTVHETNTPLSVILTSIELFVMKNKKDRQLSKIEAAAKNIFNIYDDLSYLVKKDQVQYSKSTLDLGLYLTSRVDFFREVAELSKLRFAHVVFVENVYIYFNETKLQRIIDNTITNAIKYTLANEPIYIELKKVGTFVELSVGSRSKEIKDTEKIFEAYYREEQKREGFGIGLRLVRTICDEEEVAIVLDSTNEKTTFTYRFKMMGA
ncbi:MAG: HAMP domain-containing sensor histidine kinase [Sulfurimonas sp.]|nr:HAMP domain-containing sensor histidine kinase [Sulfurimonas sp.]MDD5202215.1 HAMP domain-containing sensor histidine kinase [Sulfurimonas sp.]